MVSMISLYSGYALPASMTVPLASLVPVSSSPL